MTSNILSFDNPVLKHRRKVPRLALAVVSLREATSIRSSSPDEQLMHTIKILSAAGHAVLSRSTLIEGLDMLADKDFNAVVFVGPSSASVTHFCEEAALLQMGHAFVQIVLEPDALVEYEQVVRDVSGVLSRLERYFGSTQQAASATRFDTRSPAKA